LYLVELPSTSLSIAGSPYLVPRTTMTIHRASLYHIRRCTILVCRWTFALQLRLRMKAISYLFQTLACLPDAASIIGSLTGAVIWRTITIISIVSMMAEIVVCPLVNRTVRTSPTYTREVLSIASTCVGRGRATCAWTPCRATPLSRHGVVLARSNHRETVMPLSWKSRRRCRSAY
jgi:hypothetical protein